jgi:TolB protein
MLYVSLKTGTSHNLLSTLGLMGPDSVLSPDGTKILYVPFYQTDATGTQIYALNIAGVDGSSPTVRYSTTASASSLAPLGFGTDNATIYAYGGGALGTTAATLYRLDPGSNTPVAVQTLPGNLGHPNISPTGAQILSTVYPGAKAEIAIANINGSGQKTLTTGAANDQYPVFSHDGTKIYFVSDRDGDDEIYAMNTDGSGVTRLTYNFADDTHPISRGARRTGHVRLFR